jgi:hypothetical protein
MEQSLSLRRQKKIDAEEYARRKRVAIEEEELAIEEEKRAWMEQKRANNMGIQLENAWRTRRFKSEELKTS